MLQTAVAKAREWIGSGLFNYRINRATYWASIASFMLLLGVFAHLGKLSGGIELMMVVVGIPRLHDIGRSGWLIGAAVLAEFTIFVGLMSAGASSGALEISLSILVLLIAALAVWLGFVPGQSESNRWGEPPAPGIRFGKFRRRHSRVGIEK